MTPIQEKIIRNLDERDAVKERCGYCGHRKRKDCDGAGWLEPLGPYQDGSYMTSRPCPNDDPFYETH